jgi:c-di-GMP-binding flagellar brake protein YcgR
MNKTYYFNAYRSAADRRQFKRFDINVPVRVRILSGEKKGKKLFLETHNLSAGGALLKSDTILREGAQIRVKIFLRFVELMTETIPTGLAIISVTGDVLRIDAERTAVNFRDDYEVNFHGHNRTQENWTSTLKKTWMESH